jgi:hypothetical protein
MRRILPKRRVAGGVVVDLAARVARVVAPTIADADVEIAVLAEVQVPGIVTARRRDVVDHHILARRVDRVAGHDEARDPIYGIVRIVRIVHRTLTELVEGVIEIDVTVRREARV